MGRSRFRETCALISALAMGAGAVACYSTSGPNSCCGSKALDTQRRCGFFNDQQCGDIILASGQFRTAVDQEVGKFDRVTLGSTTCTYIPGRCTGLFGSNLCQRDPQASLGCTSEGARRSGCDETGNDGGGGNGGQPIVPPEPQETLPSVSPENPAGPVELVTF